MTNIDILRRLAIKTPRRMSLSIPWACPIPHFGRIQSASIATIGINPSNQEFVDLNSVELSSIFRRFPTLNSLKIENWEEATTSDLQAIEESCSNYFRSNPYKRWFDKLNKIFAGTPYSYYSSEENLVHIDLVPYATAEKWGKLPSSIRSSLLLTSSNLIGELINRSNINIVILNGTAIASTLAQVSDFIPIFRIQEGWSLERKSGGKVTGHSLEGAISNIGGIQLSKPVRALGFNHNIQSSFGVTNEAIREIGNWIRSEIGRSQ